jgi:KUP system potassium uptake protein
VAVLVALFALQRAGTAAVGKLFGPVLLVWIVAMTAVAAASLARTPAALQALNPVWAVRYLRGDTATALLALGTLFLVCSGVEALYADMGQVGRRSIRTVFMGLVLPALLITYLGIGANLLHDPATIHSPLFLMAPEALQLPFVVLATCATVIASQSLISGVFSLTSQASSFGLLPRTTVVNTSPELRGQVYLPAVNWALGVTCVAVVLGFRSSNRLAGAMALSVSGTMVLTTVLLVVVARRAWRWSWLVVAPVLGGFLLLELVFLAANIAQVPNGGWLTVVVTAAAFVVMSTWWRGRDLEHQALREERLSTGELAHQLAQSPGMQVARVAGNAVFFSSEPGRVPPSLLVQLRTARALRERIYVVTAVTEDVPSVLPVQRVTTTDHGDGIVEVVLHHGFMDRTTVADDLEQRLGIRPEETYYYLDRETVRPQGKLGMARWRERLYAYLARNAPDPAAGWELPAERVVEIGATVEI